MAHRKRERSHFYAVIFYIQIESKPCMILFSRGRETLELITKGGHASLRPFRALPLFAKNFTNEYFEIFKDQTDMALFPKNNVSMLP